MTQGGKEALQVTNVLTKPRRTLAPRLAVPLEECDVFELHHKLSQRGWSYAITEPRQIPKDYVHGDEKVWWLSPTSKTFSFYYFLALLQAASHKKPVPFKAVAAQYNAIIAGRDYVKKQSVKSRRRMFNLDAEEVPVPCPPLKRVRRSPRKRVTKPGAAASKSTSGSSSSTSSSDDAEDY